MVQTLLSEKNKNFQKRKIVKNQKLGFSSCVCARVKDENFVYFQMCDAIKYRIIPFKPIFSPVERTKPRNGIVISLCLKKWLRTP